MTIARRTAKTGVMLLSAPATFGPNRRLDSKFSSAAAPGKNNPTHADKTTAVRLPSLGSTKNGARHQNSRVDVGILIATPITRAISLALASMFGFGAGFVLTQFGLRFMQPWVGLRKPSRENGV